MPVAATREELMEPPAKVPVLFAMDLNALRNDATIFAGLDARKKVFGSGSPSLSVPDAHLLVDVTPLEGVGIVNGLPSFVLVSSNPRSG